MIDIVFVILNFNIYEETLQCIGTIRDKAGTDNYYIIIVDNGSLNDSVKELEKRLKDSPDVLIIKLPVNCGFAKGNNVGIEKAKNLGARYVCCLNDDTTLLTDNTFQLLEEKYQKYGAAVIGPAILQKDGRIGSFNHYFEPLITHEAYLEKLENMRYRFSFWDTVKNNLMEYPILTRMVYTVLNCFRGRNNTNLKDCEDLVLQGSCLFFTPCFFEKLKGFNPQTFLYAEEEFLMADLRMNGLSTLYTPSICIYHKGGVSTKKQTGKERKKRWEFRHQNVLESQRKLVQYLNQHKDEVYGHIDSIK